MSRYLPITDGQVNAALDKAVEQVRLNLPKYTRQCQHHSSVNGIYPPCDNTDWTCGFWPGEVWLAYQRTGDDAFRQAGMTMVDSFLHRIREKIQVDHHDMGFLYTPSCVAAYRLTGDRKAREAAILAADQLISRFQPKGEFIQAWGRMGSPINYRFIIDCLLNLPLLYQASRLTGRGEYRAAAYSHAKQAQKYLVRQDGTTFHTFYMDVDTGEPRFGRTAQGYSDSSCWARGQAWGVYGFALSFHHTGDRSFLDTSCRLLDYFLARLPEDGVCYWDLCFTQGDEPRDSSSAAILCCGILELLRHLPLTHPRRGDYEAALRRIMASLARDYTTRDTPQADGLLLHGVYSKPDGIGVDECMIWGDYYYMEALFRLLYGTCAYWL